MLSEGAMLKKEKNPKKKGNGDGEMESKKRRKNSEDININVDFAKKYDEIKRRELLRSATAQSIEGLGWGGDENNSDAEDESSSSEEDEHAELLTKGIDRRVRETMEAIQKKDPRIYDKNTRFFEDVNEDDSSDDDSNEDVKSDDEPVVGWRKIEESAKQKTPKLTVKDYVRESILKHGKLSDGEDEDENEDDGFDDDNNAWVGDRNSNNDEIQPRVNLDADDEKEKEEEGGEDSDEDFFKKKEKSAEELENDERELEKFIAKNAKKNGKNAGEDILLHSYLDKETPDEKERFLRDFVLNNGWLNGVDAPATEDYEIEIDQTNVDGDDDDQSDKDAAKDAEDFEAAHNYRFEQKDSDKIVSYPRTIENSMRRPDDRRKQAREARHERKKREKLMKDEDVKRLKNAKKKEIEARLLAIREAAGNEVDVQGFDLDADFDADKFNQQMEKQFGEEYYSKKDAEMKANEDAIVASNATVSEKAVIMSKDVQRADDDVKRGVQNLINEYYQLDYEGLDGDPIRFKYKQVEPESFHLSDQAILEMEDYELNRLVSLKLLAPYRSKRDVQKQAWRVKEALKKRRFEDRSTSGEQVEQEEDATKPVNKDDHTNKQKSTQNDDEIQPYTPKRRRRRKAKQ